VFSYNDQFATCEVTHDSPKILGELVPNDLVDNISSYKAMKGEIPLDFSLSVEKISGLKVFSMIDLVKV